uniref:G-protein coupled receptors family 1 profile domain-containing protein n=1 Tax=Eptatretus burgeri TaxID=7764 RepID=A0A8C4R945_EPTBU
CFFLPSPTPLISCSPLLYILCVSSHTTDIFEVNTFIIITCVLQGIVFLLGLPGNVIVIAMTIRTVSRLPGSVFILNLAVADLLLVLTLPLWITSMALQYQWPFGYGLCKLLPFLCNVNIVASLYFVMLLSVDRYLLASGVARRWRTPKMTALACLVVWLFSALIAPFLKKHMDVINITHFIASHAFVTFAIYFIIPFTVMSVCYHGVARHVRVAQAAARATRLVVLIVVTFCICWLPFFLVHLISAGLLITQHHTFEHSVRLYQATLILLGISNSHACLNPLLYLYLAKGFHPRFKTTFMQRYLETVLAEHISSRATSKRRQEDGDETEGSSQDTQVMEIGVQRGDSQQS